jgi:ribosomal protein S18 acetylase RimI-like enzyme
MNKRYLWLGVWEHNRGAIRFYERHGFVKFGEHPYYVGNDCQTDWMMRLDFY